MELSFNKIKNLILVIMILATLLFLYLMNQSYLGPEAYTLSFEIFIILLLLIFLLYVIIPSIKILYERKGTVMQRLFLLLGVVLLIILYYLYMYGDIRIYFSIFYLAIFLNIITIIRKSENTNKENTSKKEIISENTEIISKNSIISLIFIILFVIPFFFTTIYDSTTNFIIMTIFYIIIILLSISPIIYSIDSLKGNFSSKLGFYLILLFTIFIIGSSSGLFISENLDGNQYEEAYFFNQSDIYFKIPDNWYIVDGLNNRTNMIGYNVSDIYLASSVDRGEIWVEFWKNNDNLSIENLYDKWELGLKPYKETIKEYSNTTVSGVPAIVFHINRYNHDIYSNYYEIVFIKNDYVYVVGYWGKDLNLLEERANQILISFETSK